MRQAIVTKYLGPTNCRSSRVKATADAGSVIVNWDYEFNMEKNHKAAAEALMVKYNWKGFKLVSGSHNNNIIFVLVPK